MPLNISISALYFVIRNDGNDGPEIQLLTKPEVEHMLAAIVADAPVRFLSEIPENGQLEDMESDDYLVIRGEIVRPRVTYEAVQVTLPG